MSVDSSTRIIVVTPVNGEQNGRVAFELDLTAGNASTSSEEFPATPPTRTRTQTIANEVSDVLWTRPTVQAGLDEWSKSARFHRRNPAYKSFQHRRPKSAPENAGRLRRVSSLPELSKPSNTSQTSIMLEDIEEGDDDPFTRGDIRKSTRRIKDRIRTYKQVHMDKPKVVRQNIISDFRYVKWPKIKSQLQVIRSWELWKGHVKEVEGHFGTAVVSYFIFLRWLFIMNILIFALWFGFVVIPNIVYISIAQPPNIPSLLACAVDHTHQPFPNYTCNEDHTPSSLVTNPNFTLVHLLSGEGYSCNATNTFGVQTCLFESRTTGGMAYNVAHKESGSVVMVTDTLPTDCVFTNATSPEALRLCTSDIDPHIEWYQYVIDFALGEGIFNDTVLFYGRYSNSTVFVYNLPLAFLLMIIVVYTISVFLLVYKLGHAYNESYVQFGKKRNINFCNKVFTAWDYNITNPNTAKLKKVQIRTDLVEELADYDKRHIHRTSKELAAVIVIRIFTNLFTALVLLGGGVAIFYAAQLGLTAQSSNSVISLEGLVSPIIITLFNLVLPFIFSFLAQFEKFKTQSGEIKMTLFRAIIVRLSSLIVLIATLYIVIQCTQDVENIVSTASGGLADTCGLAALNISEIVSGISTNRECPVCWETFIGQEFYKLGLTNFVVSASSALGVETFRNFVSRIRWKGLGEKIGKGNFNIPKSILDLIYTQSLLWLGFIFTPLSPAIIMATTFMLFYVKKYSLVWNLAPTKRKVFRAARTNFVFIALMLFTLFLVIVIIGFSIASLRPSSNCGPFRDRTYMYSIIPDLINSIESCSAQQALNYFGSFGFQLPVYILLLLIIYAQFVVLRARKKRFNLIKKQLILEGANVTHIVGKLDNMLQKIDTGDGESVVNGNEHQSLKKRMAHARNSVPTVEINTSL